MNVKLEDVARRAGLSKATISLALNGSPRINARTRQRIEALAEEMGYHPNPYARQLVTRKSRQIGLIVPDIENVYYASLIRHVSDDLGAGGYGLSIATSCNSRLTERRVIGELLDNRVDGLLLAPVNKPNDSTAYLNAPDLAHIPLLFTTSMYAEVNRPCVMCDLYGGMKDMMGKLYDRGYRNMMLLSGPERVYCLDLRERGFRDFAREHDLGELPILHLEEVSYEAAHSVILDRIPEADIILCVNDMMALGVINALLEKGLRVPDDKAVTGYDDVIFSRVSPVPISTVRQDVAALAAASVDILLDMVQGTPVDQTFRKMLPCESRIRQSIK